jgi:hypothetical protein
MHTRSKKIRNIEAETKLGKSNIISRRKFFDDTELYSANWVTRVTTGRNIRKNFLLNQCCLRTCQSQNTNTNIIMYFYVLIQQPNGQLETAHEQEDNNQTKLR